MTQISGQTSELLANSSLFDYKRNLLKTLSKFGAAHTIAIAQEEIRKFMTVEITDQVLYRARLKIPSSVPVGTYVAETLLIRNGRFIVADDNVEIRVRKTGFEQLVSILAQDYSLFYGAMAVLVSLLLGWFAGYIFQRI